MMMTDDVVEKLLKQPNKLEPVKPESEGMTVETMGYLPMKKIKSSKYWSNVNRPEGVDNQKVLMHETAMKEGKYKPEMYVPPVVVQLKDGTFELVSGGHRHMAAENTGQTEFYVAIVTFRETSIGCADYNKLMWQSNENGEETDNTVTKNFRTAAGIKNTILTCMDLGYLPRDKSGIERGLKDQKIRTNANLYCVVFNDLLSTIDESAETVRIYSDDEKKEIERLETTPSTHVLVKTMKAVGGIDKDYDMRLFQQIVEFLSTKTSKTHLNVLLHWTSLNPTQLRAARLEKSKLLDRLATMCRIYLKAYDSGSLKQTVLIRELPQLKKDRQSYDFDKAA